MTATMYVDTLLNSAGTGATNFPQGLTLASGSTLSNYTNATTWTPTFFLGATSQTLSTAIGRYWRIGSLVYVSGRIVLGGAKSGSGSVSIQGLPVTSANINASIRYPLHITGYSGITGLATKGTWAFGEIGNNTTTAGLAIGTTGGANGNMQDTDITTTVDINFSGWYAV